MTAIVFHAGFVKTATSTLQESVFPALRGINYLGIPGKTADLDAAIRDLCRADGTRWRAAQAAEIFGGALKDGCTNLVSYENYALYESTDKAAVAERIRKLFPAARIMFTIRRQDDLVKSWYLQQLRKRTASYLPLDGWIELQLQNPENSIFDDVDYNGTIQYYETLFGRSQTGVFLYEDLKESPAAFAKKLADFLGLDGGDEAATASILASSRRNPGLTARHAALAKFVTYAVPGLFYRACRRHTPAAARDMLGAWLGRGGSPRLEIGAVHEKKIRDLCADGNRLLAERYGLDLAKHDYPL